MSGNDCHEVLTKTNDAMTVHNVVVLRFVNPIAISIKGFIITQARTRAVLILFYHIATCIANMY